MARSPIARDTTTELLWIGWTFAAPALVSSAVFCYFSIKSVPKFAPVSCLPPSPTSPLSPDTLVIRVQPKLAVVTGGPDSATDLATKSASKSTLVHALSSNWIAEALQRRGFFSAPSPALQASQGSAQSPTQKSESASTSTSMTATGSSSRNRAGQATDEQSASNRAAQSDKKRRSKGRPQTNESLMDPAASPPSTAGPVSTRSYSPNTLNAGLQELTKLVAVELDARRKTREQATQTH